jgi:hypothetical protein
MASQRKETLEQAEQSAESAACTDLDAIGTALEAMGNLSTALA